MEVSEQTIDVLEYLYENFGAVIDQNSGVMFSEIQTLCDKYIQWEIRTSIVWLVVGAMFLIVGIIIFPKATAEIKRFREDDQEDLMSDILIIVTVLCIVIGTLITYKQIVDIVKCHTFLELQTIEYLNKQIYKSIEVR